MSAPPATPRLPARGWHPATRQRLERLIQAGAGQRLPVTFDFDNTLVCGDIGEATLAWLTQTGELGRKRFPASLAPRFVTASGRRVSLAGSVDLTAYYEATLAMTAHGETDPTPQANGYVWAVEAMQGLPVNAVTRATARVFARSRPGATPQIEVTRGRTAYPVPYFYPEMVDLLALLLRQDFEVWIVSASNVWSVRWMVCRALNPLLSQRAGGRTIPAANVIGVSTLLRDRHDRWHKDPLLVRENPAYARLEPRTLARYQLTSRLHFPVPTYAGKVAAIWQALGRRPYLAAGDSPGDHAMLTFAEHRLWIARLDKPKYQSATAPLLRESPAHWIVQATQTQGNPGFRNLDPAAVNLASTDRPACGR